MKTGYIESAINGRQLVTFLWRIVMVPLRRVDYVVCHELCHLTCHDHSKEFWQLLERYLPEWKELKEELRQTGALLVI